MEITVNKLTKKYKDVIAVNSVDFSVKENQIFALLGVNGAGKTTTIKMMTGLIPCDSGKIFYDGKDFSLFAEQIKKFINVSPQETAVADNLTVLENLRFIAGIYGFDKKTIKEKTQEIIEQFNLESVKNKKAKLLSGGMKRRLSIAMALVSQPKVLFLDEPTLGLDVLARTELWKLILSLKQKMSVILTTHYMEEAQNLADQVAIMKDGKIIEIDSPNSIIEKTNTASLEQAFIKIVQEIK